METYLWKLCCLKIQNDRLWRSVRAKQGFSQWVKNNDGCSYPRMIMELTISKLVDIRRSHGHEEEKIQTTRGKVLTTDDFDFLYDKMTELWKKIFQPNYCCVNVIILQADWKFLYSRQKELHKKLMFLSLNVE